MIYGFRSIYDLQRGVVRLFITPVLLSMHLKLCISLFLDTPRDGFPGILTSLHFGFRFPIVPIFKWRKLQPTTATNVNAMNIH